MGLIQELQIGIPRIVYRDERMIRVAVEDCFCKGLPVLEEKMVCDLEGAILDFSSFLFDEDGVLSNLGGFLLPPYEGRTSLAKLAYYSRSMHIGSHRQHIIYASFSDRLAIEVYK